ncbi:PTS lactose transporter subunit IIB [Saccharopolyspora sp. HNM0986]|nr:PTS lactose transporter subunit IIB [Saccharopolyspora sp. HNM0986]
MGSSALVAAQLSEQLGPHRVAVVHASVGDLPADADLVLCQETLLERVRREDIGGAVLLGFRSFLGDPVFDEVAQAVRDGGRLGG